MFFIGQTDTRLTQNYSSEPHKIKKTLCYASEKICSFVFNFENMQKENRFQTGKWKSFYNSNFKKIKHRYISFHKCIFHKSIVNYFQWVINSHFGDIFMLNSKVTLIWTLPIMHIDRCIAPKKHEIIYHTF